MKTTEAQPIQGVIEIREICKETGEILSTYSDENVITHLGMNTLWLRSVYEDLDTNMKLKNFHLGIDYGAEEGDGGTWTQLDPKPAEKGYTSDNQFVVYAVPETDMVIQYPDANKVQYGTLLDGKYILDTFFPGDVDMRYSSATLRFENDTTFSYKRFPVRSLSRLIDVQIIWTFTIYNEEDYVCPV